MISFLVALVFAPVLMGLLWMYMSPLPRLDGHTPVKVIIRIVLFLAIFGGFFAQLNFLAHSEPSTTRRIYLLALIYIECIPMLFILFYRDRMRRRSKPASHTDSGPSLGTSEAAGQGAGSRQVQVPQKVQWLWITSIVSLGIFVSRLYHSAQLNRLHLAVDQQYKMITLMVAGISSGSVIALLRACGVIKKE